MHTHAHTATAQGVQLHSGWHRYGKASLTSELFVNIIERRMNERTNKTYGRPEK